MLVLETILRLEPLVMSSARQRFTFLLLWAATFIIWGDCMMSEKLMKGSMWLSVHAETLCMNPPHWPAERLLHTCLRRQVQDSKWCKKRKYYISGPPQKGKTSQKLPFWWPGPSAIKIWPLSHSFSIIPVFFNGSEDQIFICCLIYLTH